MSETYGFGKVEELSESLHGDLAIISRNHSDILTHVSVTSNDTCHLQRKTHVFNDSVA